jgi:c-di-GMP-binding flagellar brake protein YcgR
MPLTLPHLPQPLKVWEKIGIVVGEEPEFGRYVSRIEDITDQGIFISAPEFVDGSSRLREGVTVAALLTRDDAVYRMMSTITQQPRNGVMTFMLSIPISVARVQRRQYVRIDIHERADYAVLTDGWDKRPTGEEFSWHQSLTENLSGGGIMLQTHDLIPVGTLLVVKIPLLERNGLPESVIGVCRRSTTRERHPLAGLEFLTTNQLPKHFSMDQISRFPSGVSAFDKIAQNKLVNYVFQRQIDMRKKGLL